MSVTGATRAFILVTGVVLAVAALKLARPVVLPLVIGLFLTILAYPLYRRMRRALPRRIRWLSLVATMLLLLGALGGFAAAVAVSGRAVVRELRTREGEIRSRLQAVRSSAAEVGVALPGGVAGGQSDPAGTSSQGSGGGSTTGQPARTVAMLVETAGGLLLALAFAALGLAEAGEARARLARVRGGDRVLAALDEAGPAFRRYVWVKSLTSAITGVATALASLALGLPLAWVWGFIAFLLEYVPSVGSVLAILPPTLMALAVGGPVKAATVFLVIGALQVILGNVVDPRIEGRLMQVSPFGVLLSIVFWGWLWGAMGALLAVPLTIAVVIACRHVPGAEGVAVLVAGDGEET